MGSESGEEEFLQDQSQIIDLENVFGLESVKETLLNIFVYPALFPEFFPKKINWNKILLYGPPGTGKTMLAQEIANAMNATFQCISCADLLSHWQGEEEGEKQIQNLFQKARSDTQITILFFDEIDGLCRKRTLEDDNVRRIKTELLTQFASDLGNHSTYIIGATNCPWEIDHDFMRRFHKKIFVPLPEKTTRLEIINNCFEGIGVDLTAEEWEIIGEKTEGYSFSDLMNVAMRACCERFLTMKNCKYWDHEGRHDSSMRTGDLWMSGSETRMNFRNIPKEQMRIRNLIFSDLEAGIANTSKTVSSEEMKKYMEFSSKIINYN